MAIGQDLLNVPMGAMIRDMAFAIADSQFQLDQSGMRTAEMMGGLQSVYDREGNQTFDDSRIFFGYEYMTVSAALKYAIMDDALTGSLDEDSIRLKEVVIDIIKELNALSSEDRSALDTLRGNAGATAAEVPDLTSVANETVRVPTRLSMMELGFTPTFYQFVDTIIEVKIAIKMTREREYSRTTSNATRERTRSGRTAKRGGGIFSLFSGRHSRSYSNRNTVQTAQVDATYSSKYSYSAEGSSLLRTKLVPVPPPAILEERIRSMVDLEDELRRARLADVLEPDEG